MTTDFRVATANRQHTQEQLLEYFTYNFETGELFWKIDKNRAKAGDKVCTPHPSGYLAVQIDCIGYLVHRVIWCLIYGEFPESLIDHKDLDKQNNRLDNLRQSNGSGNCCNSTLRSDNTSGVKGVGWHSKLRKWQVRIQVNRKRTTNYFTSFEDAKLFIENQRQLLHKEFANSGVTT